MNEREIFIEAVRLSDPAEQADFLSSACGHNESLRLQVLDLLAAHARSQSFLESPPSALAVAVAIANREVTENYKPITEGPGSKIGPYKLLQQIGEGGFGTVYMAEQQHPVRRKVALKIIKPGMDTKEVIARFQSERQALALMDHPNIAKVLDAGATDSGRPFFVMELVKGIPITQLCDESRLPIEGRLELFICVCNAVQHAHQKGVIHRDLKPSNVMVTMHDGRPVPKVIDFGVAKATSQQLTEQTLFTAYGQMIGTPAYMSPEQAELSGLDIDTRSDVYSLGVLLYELLTGTTPFDSKALRAAGFDEMRRIIREVEPETVSTRIAKTRRRGSGISTAVSSHHSPCDVPTSSTPNSAFRVPRLSELDWIVTRSLEKDRTRRYESPSSLAADIQRYLNDEPVQACPPSAAYRFRKFARRNRRAVAAAGAILLCIVAGIVGTTLGMVHARHERYSAEIARQEAVAAQLAETEQRRVAERNEQRALAAAEAEQKAKQIAQAREAETNSVLDFVEKRILAATRPEGGALGLGHDVSLRQALEIALPSVKESFPNQPLTEARLRRTMGLSFWFLGQYQIAAEQYEAARALYAQHDPEQLDLLQTMNGLVNSYNALGRHAEALQLGKEVLSLRKSKLGLDHPDTFRSMHNLANSYNGLGLYAEALQVNEETLARRTAAFGADHSATLQTMGMLANSYNALHQYDRALELHQEVLARRKAKLGPEHPDTAWSMCEAARSYANLGRHAEAVELYQEAVAVRKAKLGPTHPETLRTMNGLAESLMHIGRLEEAIASYTKAIELEPTDAKAHINLGVAQWKKGDLDAAIASYTKAIKLEPTYAKAHYNLGVAQRKKGDFDAAIASFTKAIELDPKSAAARIDLGNALSNLQKYDEAITYFQQAIAVDPRYMLAYYNLGVAQWKKRDVDAAIVSYTKAIELEPTYAKAHYNLGVAQMEKGDLDAAIASSVKAIELKPTYAKAHHNLGVAQSKKGDLDAAIASFTKAIELEPTYAKAHYSLGVAQSKKGDRGAAITSFTKAIELDPKYAAARVNLGNLLSDLQKYGEAIAYFQEAIANDPKYMLAYFNLGIAQWKKGDLDAAIASYTKATELEPTFSTAHYNLGLAQWKTGDLNAAIISFTKATELAQTDSKGHYSLGVSQLKKGNLDAAIASLTKTIELEPTFSTAHYNLGTALYQQCRWQEAVAAFARAAELRPESIADWQWLGWAQYRAGQWQASLDSLEKSCLLQKGGDCGQWIVLALAHGNLARSDELPQEQRDRHEALARRRYDQAAEQVSNEMQNSPDSVSQAIWHFREEARKLLDLEEP